MNKRDELAFRLKNHVIDEAAKFAVLNGMSSEEMFLVLIALGETAKKHMFSLGGIQSINNIVEDLIRNKMN